MKLQKNKDKVLHAIDILRKDFEGSIELTENQQKIFKAIVIKECSKDIYFFARYVLDMDLLTEETHKKWADNLLNAIKSDKKRVMRLKPRATYKTSLYGVTFVLWLWGCINLQIRIFYTSANSLLLSEVSDKIDQYVGSEKEDTFFSYIFNVVRDLKAKNTSEVFNIQGRSGKGFSFVLRTSGGSTVGIHPNVVIIDDPLDQNDRESEATRQQKERWFDTLTPLLVPFLDRRTGYIFESIFYIGTVWHMRDLIWYIHEMNKKLPDNLKWDIERESILNDEGKSNYPDFISDEKIAAIRANMSEVFFACQYLNHALPEGLLIFDLKKMHFTRLEQVDFINGRSICVFDPSKGKESSAYPAVWWLHYVDNKLYVFDAIDEKVEISLLIHHIAARNRMYGCKHMIFENNNAILIEEALRDAHILAKTPIHIESVYHSTNKDERIISMQPDIYSGFVVFMDDYEERYPEAMRQITFYPAYGMKDFPDCLQIGIEYFRKPHFQFVRYEELY